MVDGGVGAAVFRLFIVIDRGLTFSRHCMYHHVHQGGLGMWEQSRGSFDPLQKSRNRKIK